nr:adhesion protein FadA [Fusobacterium russii]
MIIIALITLFHFSYSMGVVSEINNIETEYQELLLKEAEKLEEFKAEKLTLENELVKLKEREVGKEEVFVKLGRDSEIRWHRDEYKKLEKRYEEYYNKLEKAIAEREGKIAELEKLISIMSE